RCGALETRIQDHLDRLARARHALEDRMGYPEADFTLRLSDGSVQPYPAEGTLQPPFTTFGGLFDRADAWGPLAEDGSWALPARWLQRRRTIDPSVSLNFITINDITGGSSGSPVVDRRGELVGLVFDGNLQSIAGRFRYDPLQNRCIAVDARAILEALRKVYDADGLVEELTSR
ncbi:MAG TPA: S46 family peptidase, partial [Holophaga sp.]|nr:S46 family peptidase [Holophaga sp.]